MNKYQTFIVTEIQILLIAFLKLKVQLVLENQEN